MVAKPNKPATYEDIVALPANMVGQIIDGTLYAHSRPATPHAIVTTTIGEELGPPFRRGRGGPGGWIFLDEPELHFRHDVLVPDLAGWRRERMPEIPEAPFLTLAPDWICEVLSPSTEGLDRVHKMNVYARERVAWAWLVHPVEKTLEIYELGGDTWRRADAFEGSSKVRARPFDAIELDMSLLWAR